MVREGVLSSGAAAIPLEGIDIPFHSTLLRPHIDAFREYLLKEIPKHNIIVDKLVGRWIPNVLGRPFEITADFAREVKKVTGSSALDMVIETLEKSEEADTRARCGPFIASE